jgi:chemotaxis protein MotB
MAKIEEEIEEQQDMSPEEEAPEGAPEWMVTYGDLVTLLLCFFVLLFSMSKVEKDKYEAIAASLKTAIGKDSVPEAGTKAGLMMMQSDSLSKQNAVDELGGMVQKEIKKIDSEVKEFIFANKLGGQVKTKTDEKGFIITISDVILFQPGKAVIEGGAYDLLDKIKDILSRFEYSVRIEGHTDNSPIKNAQYPSNWELSSARACEVVRFFIDKGIPPDRLSAEGFAEYRPLKENNSAEGRASNRRVEIVFVREAMEKEINRKLEESKRTGTAQKN